MQIKTSTGLLIIFAATVLIGGGALAWANAVWPTSYELEVQMPIKVKKKTATPTLSPTKVVENFYSWYLKTSNAMDKLEESTYLSSDLPDELKSSSESAGIDKVVCAQDMPKSFTVKEKSKTASEAKVIVTEKFEPPVEVTVTLKLIKNSWKISSIICPST